MPIYLIGPLKIDIFRKSIDILFTRHHVLFSRIIEKEGVPCCVIEKTEVQIEFIDYSCIESKDGESSIFKLINEDSRRVFDMANGPLYRLYLFSLSDEEYYFYCAIHHIVFDGWSWKIFIDDLNQIYHEKATNLAGVLQDYDIGPGDFIGLLLKRSPELIICLLAIFKTGATYVPLNLADPDNRIRSNIISSEN